MNVNFISTGTTFPYSYYIGVVSAMRAFPGEVVLWTTREPRSKYFDLLKKRKNLRIVPCDVPFNDLSVLDGLTEHEKNVAKFDMVAWHLAVEYGGIIAGLDSLTIKRWDDLLPKEKEMLVPRDSEAVPNSYTMHGVMVKKGSKLAEKIFSDICMVMAGEEPGGKHKSLKDGKLKWGGAGIIPFLNNVYNNVDKVEIVPVGMLGGVNPDSKKTGFYIHQDKDKGEFLHKDTRSIPLYASSNKHFDEINEDYVANSNTVYGELVKTLLPERVWNVFNKPIYGFGIGTAFPIRLMKKKFRFHLLGLVHLPTSEKYMSCAFTQKNVKMAKMLMDLGHEVYLYGAEGSDAPCTKFVRTHSLKDIRDTWGEGDNRFEIGYNWQIKQFKHDFNTVRRAVTLKYYHMAITEINKIKRPDDFLLITQGTYQKPIDQGVKLTLTCEPGIGYRGSYSKFRSFESTYIQNFTYGSEHPRQSINGAYYDRVIPNYFDEKDFPFVEKKKDYYLYMGRLITRKGVRTALMAVEAIGGRLVLAGQKDPETKGLVEEFKCAEYVGYADTQKRARLMGEAKAVFCPSTYLEPFCGVHAEAMLCGTPVITTNFGAFTDYVVDGLNGYRCNTLQDFVYSAKLVDKLNPKVIRKYAERFTLDKVKLEYQRWFQDLYRVWQSIVNPKKKAWHYI